MHGQQNIKNIYQYILNSNRPLYVATIIKLKWHWRGIWRVRDRK